MADPRRDRLHVIGAGLAGLSAAVRGVLAGRAVTVHESAGHAGGRCRSYYDRHLDREIDNGSHLLLHAYEQTRALLAVAGAPDTLLAPSETAVEFVDIAAGLAWTLRPGDGRLPFWLFDRRRRVPGSRPADYLEALRLFTGPPDAVVADRLDPAGPLYERLWRPLVEGVMNCTPEEADARLMARVLRLTFGAGGRACRPLLAPRGLGPALIEPLTGFLAAHGAEIRFGRRLRALDLVACRVARLQFGDGEEALGPADQVVLAVPAHGAAELLPDLNPPTETRAIANVHFRVDGAAWAPGFTGIVGAMSQWLFRRGDVASVTISAAERYAHLDAEGMAGAAWAELSAAERLRARADIDRPPSPSYRSVAALLNGLPPFRVVREKRATILQSPAALRQRPSSRTDLANLVLAGDWTQTGLPATIEGAILSGRRAVEAADMALRS